MVDEARLDAPHEAARTAGLAPSDRAGALARPPGAMRRDLRTIWVDGLAWALMVGMGELYIAAFAVALGYGETVAGLVSTVPLLLGATVQLLTPTLVELVGSQRRFVSACAFVQATSFLPMLACAILGDMPAWALYGSAALYWAAGLSSHPPWSTWVATLVPPRVRIRYFARRHRMLHVFQVLGLFAGGWILQVFAAAESPLLGFTLVFGFASVARVYSSVLLARQGEVEPLPRDARRVRFLEYLGRFRHGSDGRVLVYILSLQFSAYVSAPYFAPYMLETLRLGYLEYMALVAAAVAAKFAATPLHGRFAERHGVQALLWLGAIGTVPTSAMWILSDDFAWLLCAQVFAGFAWAAWELATLLTFFESIPHEERTSVLSCHNFANACAVAGGSLAGAALLSAFGGGAQGLMWLFGASSVLRLLTLLLLRRVGPPPSAASVLENARSFKWSP